MESPPKRMTRSRAAKVTEAAGQKTSKTVTPAAKAKASATATSTRATTTKRKTRADDHDDDPEPTVAPSVRATRARGRPKKVEVTTEPIATAPSTSATRSTRSTRAKKITAEPAMAEPARTRGRPRKVATQTQDEETQATAAAAAAEPAKKTRTTTMKTTESFISVKSRATGATKSSIKKTVTFEEPEKENMAPVKAKAVEKPATGLRAKPVRKAATAKTAAAHATKKTEEEENLTHKTPLSPKKITQMRVRQEELMSDDELALNDQAPLRKSPIRTSIFHGSPQKTDISGPHQQLTVNVSVNAPEMTEPSNVLVSPARRPPPSTFRDAMKSPAKRIEGMALPLPSAGNSNQQSGGVTPFRASLLQSPAKRCPSAIKSMGPVSLGRSDTTTPFKNSLLQTPARRPMSAFKGFASTKHEAETAGSPATRPAILSTPTIHPKPSDMLMDGEEGGTPEGMQPNLFSEPPPSLKFPGRLSALLSRDADPAVTHMGTLEEEMLDDDLNLISHHPAAYEHTPCEEIAEMAVDLVAPVGPIEAEDDDMTDPKEATGVDAKAAAPEEEPLSPAGTTTPPDSPPKSLGMFGLREKDLDPCQGFYDESEDELAGSFHGGHVFYETPAPARKTPKAKRVKPPRVSNFGFTPLAAQLGSWSATSHFKAPQPLPEEQNQVTHTVQQSPFQQTSKPTFFDDEMVVRHEDDFNAQIEAAIEADIAAQIGDPVFEDMVVTDEDIALANEANEMSLTEPDQLAELGALPEHDDSVSDASQDYGDENEVPIDPALLGQGESTTAVPPVTPGRVLTKTFHTVSKVPLKPADDSTPTPRSLKNRSNSVSRLGSPRRPTLLTRNATVISYSPTKERRTTIVPAPPTEEIMETCPPVTPSKSDDKSDIWSTLGTPNRTPRRDLDPALLKGAVVYVDVHTSEGADASGIFVELLGQMGARCVKNWTWTGGESSKIGITHVVYKDGGKRTLEKVRDSRGVVQCVGVSWVLDCERENKWLDEPPYYIDTSLVPRGGARRRKSMEPKALANLNGTLVSSPVKQSRDVSQTVPSTPAFNRRDSYAWIRTPPEQKSNESGDMDWDQCELTPVPRTPALEEIHRCVEEIMPETPTAAFTMDDESDLMTARTCPPKNKYSSLGEGVLSPEKDTQVMMRLMAARRKSLQFAPKVGSPLSKTWT